MLRRSNPAFPLTHIEPTHKHNGFSLRPELLTNQNGRAQLRTTRIIKFVLLVAFLFVAAASEARADVFSKNQRMVQGGSPATIPLTYDNGGTFTGTVPAGTLVHIIYGIQVNASNAGTSPVSLGITLPTAFSPTATTFNPTTVRCLKFAGGASVGTSFACSLPTIGIGALSATDDKVIVVIDGIFTQAGAFTANFVATRGATTEPTSLNMNADVLNLPVDIGLTKQVKPKTGGSYGSTTTVPIYPSAGTLTYKLTVKNLSATTDVYLGKLLRLQDTLSTPPTNDVVLAITVQNFQCTPSSASVACPAMPGSPPLPSLGPWNSVSLPVISYPGTSNGFLPAGGSFEITFDAAISTSSPCSPIHNNKLHNQAFLTYSDGTTTISDTNPSNNTSVLTIASLPVPGLPTTCPPPLGIQVTKTLLSPAVGSWSPTVFTYKITVKNINTVSLSGLVLNDNLSTNPATPAFTATPSNVVCSPACTSPPVLFTPLMNPSSQANLFTASFAPLAPNAVQTVQYQVKYAAPCATTPSVGAITNIAQVSGPVSGMAQVITSMPALSLCPLQVTKAQTIGPVSFASFPVTLGYQVKFKNTSPTQTLTVRTLIDAMAVDSPNYGDIPIDYSYSCTVSGVAGVNPALLNYTSPLVPQPIMSFNNPVWAGIRLIDLSSPAGAVFSPGGTITCNMTVKLKQPPTNDSKCQGAGAANFVNSAFMDVGYPFNTNLGQPAVFQKVVRPLPKCVSIVVGKTVSPNVVAGGPVTFTLTVKNAGNDPTPAGIKLNDNVPGVFGVSGWSCLPSTACSPSSGGVGNNISVNLNPIAGGATATVVVTGTAPTVPGAYCNTDNATFNPFPPLTYFEGNQSALTTASACVQVNPKPSKPKLTKKFEPSVITLGQPVKVVFTITNAAGTGAQSGLAFADVLPNPPFTTSTVVSNTCNGTPLANGNMLALINGSLPAGPSSCTVVFQMAPPTKCGVFKNTPANMHDVKGLDYSDLFADLTVDCGQPMKGDIQKVLLGVPGDFAGTFNFDVTCTPPGGSPVTSTQSLSFTASDPLVPYKGGLMAKIKTISMGTLAQGTTCTVTEAMPLPPLPANCKWLPPTYSPANGTATATGSGTVKFTVLNRLSCSNIEEGTIFNKQPELLIKQPESPKEQRKP